MEKCYDSNAEMANRSQCEFDQVFEVARRHVLLSADTSDVIADPLGIKMRTPPSTSNSSQRSRQLRRR